MLLQLCSVLAIRYDRSDQSPYLLHCTGYTDHCLGIDGLAAVVTQQYGSYLDEESLFLFSGRQTDRIKALYWSGDGHIILYKRLSNGRFQWPRPEAELRLLKNCRRCNRKICTGVIQLG